ncbi:prepilin-type N-terminal cleavage/methylation domain-containing protein [Pseudotenacibaculum haliotis]|uniref:Prepilin-type N-terminal cleavage/methylation domain-containing protein n=1 Tax=Pseudotenacibaculum haliotis TaxID=1862138 RepID=A0ABW5LUT8_9FLAO
MNTTKKIQAFTLSELLVVLVISSIVVTLSFLALGNVQKQVRSINQTFEKQQQIIKLERWITMDINTSKARFDQNNKVLECSNAKETAKYRFTESGIIRGTDTLKLVPKKMKLYLDGEEVKSGTVDALEFTFSDTYAQKGFFVFKRKDASYYMNN